MQNAVSPVTNELAENGNWGDIPQPIQPRRISPDAATHAISAGRLRQPPVWMCGRSHPPFGGLLGLAQCLPVPPRKNSGSVILKLTATLVAGRIASGSSSQVSR